MTASNGPEVVDYLRYEPEDGILWITFNRPEVLNALHGYIRPDSTLNKLGEYLDAADADPDIRVIVITGEGRGFCSGADQRGGRDHPGEARPEGADGSRQFFTEIFTPLFRKISSTRKPTIAMVNGVAVGAGLDIALHCDIRIGCPETRFFTYQNVGQLIHNGGMYFLPRMIGLGNALEFLYTGGFLVGEDAYRMGLLNHYVPREELRETTRELCRKIIASPPLVQWIGKRIMRTGLDSSFDTTLQLSANASGITGNSDDAREARAARRERREPMFRGR